MVQILFLSGCAPNPTVSPTKTDTHTPLPPTDTHTPLPPTDTHTPLPPKDTHTPPPPTDTVTPTPTFLPCEERKFDSGYELPCKHTLEQGDSYYGLAQIYYEDQRLGLKILDYNRLPDGTFVDLNYDKDERIHLNIFARYDLLHSRYGSCVEDCITSIFPCIFVNGQNLNYWQISEMCYGIETYSNLIEKNNPYSDNDLVIPDLVVNGAIKIDQKLEELQKCLELGDYDCAFNLHSHKYRKYIINQPNGFDNVFVGQFFGYMCVNPHAIRVMNINQNYDYWEALVEIYRCKDSSGSFVSDEIMETSVEKRNVCFIVEQGIWMIDDWREGTDNHCP